MVSNTLLLFCLFALNRVFKLRVSTFHQTVIIILKYKKKKNQFSVLLLQLPQIDFIVLSLQQRMYKYIYILLHLKTFI